jgi:beta-N-acetylhexosaminidase
MAFFRVAGLSMKRFNFALLGRIFAPASAILVVVFAVLVAGTTRNGPPIGGEAAVPGSAPEVPPVTPPTWAEIDPEALAWVESSLAQLDLRQKVAQLVFPWIRGGSIPRNSADFRRIRRWIEEDEVGGLIVSRGPAGEFAPMMNALQALAPVPLLIVSDLETGPAMRLTGGTNFPPAMAFGAAGSEELAYAAGRATAREARAAGIHVTLGPVLDVNSNPQNPIINTRSFGEHPQEVARIASAWIQGARAGGLLTVGKHFPGHGATEVDSHVSLPTLSGSLEALEALDIVPFRSAIEIGMHGVLVGHIAVPALDGPNPPPASLSRNVVQGLLREQLRFDGLVFTDALNMGAITRNYSVEEASILAILAGADALLQPPGERSVIDAIVAAVRLGRIPEERIDEAARRVLLAKASAGLHSPVSVRAPGGAAPAEHRALVTRIAEASLTLARDRPDLVPLPANARRILHVAYSAPGTQFNGQGMNAVLQAGGRSVDGVRVDGRTPQATYSALADRATRADLVVVSANLAPREYRPLVMEDNFSRFVEGIIARGVPVVAVSFGSPYLLDYFPSVPSYLLSWSSSAESQRAAARALLGSIPITGTLPVSIPPGHTRGQGITRAAR